MSLNPIDIPNTNQNDNAGVDRSCDLSPTSPVDRQRMDRMMADRPSHKDLQSKGILKGAPNDALAGKKADLARKMTGDRLGNDLAHRPTADELVKKGILHREHNKSEDYANESS